MKPPRLCFCTLRCLMILGAAAFIAIDASNQSAVENWAVDRLADYMDVLCPYDTICRDGEPKLQIAPDRGRQSCCTECSCDESCGLTENCCFPDQDVHTTVERSHRECVAASSRVEEEQPRRDYYMVVDGHLGGTGEFCGEEGNTTCGENDDATPLGRLYPVTSRATGIIYKNAICALCHGVNKSEQLPWDAFLTCDTDYNPDTSMEAYFQTLESGKLPTICKYEFYHPASQTDANAQACYQNTIHSCKINEAAHYNIPEHLNMTEEEVMAACESDLEAPYMNQLYFNAFCYICNHGQFYSNYQCREMESGEKALNVGMSSFSALIYPKYLEEKTKVTSEEPNLLQRTACKIRKDQNKEDSDCREMESGEKAPNVGMSSFSALIYPKNLEEKTKVTSEEPNLLQRTACKIRKDQNKEDSDCRPVLCPSGQVQLGQPCVYPSQQLLSKRFMLVVKLYPREVMYASSIEILKRHFRDGLSWKTLLTSKGLRSWQLADVSYNDTLSDAGNITISYLCATFTVQRISSIQTIVSNVETIMKKDWTFRMNGQDVMFRPQFFEFKKYFHAYKENQTLATWNEIIDTNLPPFGIFDMVRPTLKRVFVGSDIWTYPSITKMMFCDQVSLEKDEYLLDAVHRRLYVNATGRLFFPLEFSLGYDRNADLIPKLCLDDAGFALQSNTASGVSITLLALVKLTVVSGLLRSALGSVVV